MVRFGCLLSVLEYAWTKGAEGAGACSSLAASAWLAGSWSLSSDVVSGCLFLFCCTLGWVSCHHGLAEQSVDVLVPSTDVAGAVRLDSLRHRCASSMGLPPAHAVHSRGATTVVFSYGSLA